MGEELKKYIKSTITAIKEGLEGTGFKIDDCVEFDLAVINTSEGAAGLKIYVAKAEGKLKSEEITHIKFKASPEDTNKAPINRTPNDRLKDTFA